MSPDDQTAVLKISEKLLPVLAGDIDLRQVIKRLSDVTKEVLPHDRLTLASYDPDRHEVIQEAESNDDGAIGVRCTGTWPQAGAFWLMDLSPHDGESEALQQARRETIAAGYQCALGVTLMAREQQFGIAFWSKQPHVFHEANGPLALHIGAYAGIAIATKRLVDATRDAADARARAEVLAARVSALSGELNARSHDKIVAARSPQWNAVLKAAVTVASTELTVLLTGESGTGKEVVARLIHRASRSSGGPFLGVNCAAIPEQLLESELFGYERGAFTGAVQSKPGLIEIAAGGILLLDEVGDMSMSAQAKLLRVLQERQFQRLGGTRPIKADVRIIAASNRDLRKALQRGEFREDLYYRLQVFEIHLPPLRDRLEDILPLTAGILDNIGKTIGRPAAGITRETKEALLAYHWPGNVRELRNALERATILAEGGLIAPEHLWLPHEPARLLEGSTLEGLERQLVEQATRESGGNKSIAARRLGITRKQLYVRLRKYAGP